MSSRPEVVVVGNGALGLFLAATLARRSVPTVVIGEPHRPMGASKAAGAMLGLFGEVTTDTFRTAYGRAKFAMGLAAHKHWPAVLAELSGTAKENGESLHTVADTHIVLNGCGGSLDTANYHAIAAALRDHRVPHEEAEPGDIPGYRPRPDGRALRSLLIRGEGAIDGNQVLRLLERSLSRQGVRLGAGSVQRLLADRGRITGVQLQDGEKVEADVVVVAAGVQTVNLLHTVLEPHRVQPMLSGVGTSFVIERKAPDGFETVVRTPNRGGACGLHLVPLADGREYVGASNLVSAAPGARGTVATSHVMLQQLTQQLDETAGGHAIHEWRVGNRPVPLDGFPLIGWTSVTGLYSLTGTYRDGFHAAPALAEHVADQISGGPGTLDLPFGPERNPIASWTVPESIEEYATHMTSLWFELGGRAPASFPTAAIAHGHRHDARRLYERTGVGLGLNADVLAYLTSAKDKVAFKFLLNYLDARGLLRAGRR